MPHKTLTSEIAADIRAIFNAADRQVAKALLIRMVTKYEKTAAVLGAWIEANLPDGLTVCDIP